MEIKIDTTKDSVESLQQVQKILKNKTQKERDVKKPKKQANLKDADEFLTLKYGVFIIKTLSSLCQRDILETEEYTTSTWDKQKELRKDVREELIIDQSTLFREFVKQVRDFNFPSVDPYIFQNALKYIIGKPIYEPISMYINNIKLGKKNLLRVLF
ncbi:MAG: hypothetical protein KKC75_03660 [Nanoarchaeota archaeon]|nr:hypothetical protein [Nanoarchaeota archaeon]MBU1005105.1 hypothetical protein [Nanoarchaeota archaeon]MBU1945433.1 hypothetical protein [Nanoarchaeota archaeon]